MRKSRYGEAESGEIKLEAYESFFRNRVHNFFAVPGLERFVP
jgi:hypothetical protein